MFKVLFLCTENSCRSQMAEGLVNHYLDGKAKAFSAGVRPNMVNPRAIKAMGELGIDACPQHIVAHQGGCSQHQCTHCLALLNVRADQA